MVKSQFKSWQAQDPRRANISVRVQRQEKINIPAQSVKREEFWPFVLFRPSTD